MPRLLQRPPRRTTPRAIAVACVLALVALTTGPYPAGALIPQISAGGTPPGWSAPVVPRNTGDATDGSALLPIELATATPTYLNWAVYANPVLVGTWHDELYLDGKLVELVTRSTLGGSSWWLAVNTGPVFVPGGRHTLMISTDPDHQVETDHSWWGDNIGTRRYIWQPALLAPGAALSTTPPEGATSGLYLPDCNAFAFTRTPGTAWVVSIGTGGALPTSESSLLLYDDYASSTTGLTHEIARSTRAGKLTDFVVGAAVGAPATLYPAVVREPGSPGAAVAISAADATGRLAPAGVGNWPSVSLPANQSAHVFEAYLTAGSVEYATLTRFMGVSDLEVLVFPPGTIAAGRQQAQWTSTPRDGDDEYDDFGFTAPTTGLYLFVVARVDGEYVDALGPNFGDPVGYHFELSAAGPVGVQPTLADAPLAAAPSPAAGPMRLSFALARPEHVTLDVFDLAGRAVRRLADESLAAGPHALVWDGRDERGAEVATGRYWARLTAGSRRESLPISRVR